MWAHTNSDETPRSRTPGSPGEVGEKGLAGESEDSSIPWHKGSIAPNNWPEIAAKRTAASPYPSSESPARLVSNDQAAEKPDQARIVIYIANLRVVVKDAQEAMQHVEKLAEQVAGYVSTIQGDAITIRVPAASYKSVIADIETLGKITLRELQALDKTEEFVDLEARLKNAEALRERLKALLAKAEDVKAALEVERELGRVSGEIESLQAKIKYLKDQAAMSTISVTFEHEYHTPPPAQAAQLPFEWLRLLDPRRLTSTY